MADETQGQSSGQSENQPAGTTVRQTEDGGFVLKINGKEQVLTAEQFAEAYQKVQKGVAAERRFEEAATKEKRLAELIRLADSGDAQAYAQMLTLANYDPELVQEKVALYQQAWAQAQAADEEGAADSGGETEPRTKTRDAQEPVRVTYEDLDPVLQQELKEQRKARLEAVRAKIYAETQEALAKDPVLGKIVGRGGSRAAKLLEQAKKTVRGRIRDGEDYGPQLLGDVVQELRDFVEEFGVGAASTSLPGLGAGPGISHAEAQAERPPEPVPITHPDYRKNFAARLAHLASQAFSGGD